MRCTPSPTRCGRARSCPIDEHLARSGRVVEILSEHTCQGILEGYLLTGRHGLFSCYEAFIHLIDSMFNQHAKWLKVTREIGWRRPIAVAELPAHLARVAAGPQRFLPPGPGFRRSRDQQEGRRGAGVLPAGHQHPAVHHRALPGVGELRQRHRGRQAAVLRLVDPRRGRQPLRPRARHLGLGVERQRRPRRGDRPAPGTCRRWRPWPPSASCGSSCRS